MRKSHKESTLIDLSLEIGDLKNRLGSIMAMEQALKLHVTNAVTQAKDEILSTIADRGVSSGRPIKKTPLRRGPKDTRMMKGQRKALVVYVIVELHKAIVDVTLSDAYHVWYLAENLRAWNAAAGRKDNRRGYKDYNSLYSAVKTLAEKNAKKLLNLTAV